MMSTSVPRVTPSCGGAPAGAGLSSPADATASSRWVPFGYGFRPFFFAALLYAPLSIAAWLWMRVAGAARSPHCRRNFGMATRCFLALSQRR